MPLRGLVVATAMLSALLVSGAANSGQTAAGCPRAALALGVNPIAPASSAALRKVAAADKPLVTSARIATYDDTRGPQVRAQCGKAALGKTVIVYISRRAYWPAQSASQGVYFVSRFAGGYRVWQVAH